MFTLQKSNRIDSARSQIDIRSVKNNVLILSRNRYRIVLSVSPVNFELKSEDEQDAIIDTYESFLNSVGSPLQILIRTREIDMDSYIAELKSKSLNELEPVYKKQLENYGEFVKGLISTNKILTRHFYVIVPYDTTNKVDFDSVLEQIRLKQDIVQKGLSRLVMQSKQLTSLEILDLFYTFYSPEQAKIQPLTEQALELIHTGYVQRGDDNE